MSLERKIESSIFLCIPQDLNILGKSCTTFVIVKIVRNLSRGRSPCQRVNHVKSGVIYFSAFIFSYDTIHVSGTIHTWNRGLTQHSHPWEVIRQRERKQMAKYSKQRFHMFFLFNSDSNFVSEVSCVDDHFPADIYTVLTDCVSYIYN